MRFYTLTVMLLGALAATACPREKTEDGLSRAEATQALDEATVESQGETLASDTIEIATSFTLGQAVDAAAQQVADFIKGQLPCAVIALNSGTLSIDYSANGNTCSYHGHVITGQSRITIEKTDASDVVVNHQWTALSNGLIQVDGTAVVTWTSANPSRHVQHELVIERLRDQKTLDSSGDRTQIPLNGDVSAGITTTGTRSWSSSVGTWDLTIDDVQMRWLDPIPQAGSYTLSTPKHRTLNLEFQRKDAAMITVTLSSGGRSFAFDVTSTGEAVAN
jgi:hypothetical protein